MRVVVNDANILIDLVKLNLLPQFFALEYSFYTSDLILEELHLDQQQAFQPFIDSGSLTVMTFDMSGLILIGELKKEKPQLSEQDCSAIVCALNLDGELLTSDNILRQFAVSRKMPVRGHLWVFDQLVEHKIINGKQAAEKLKTLMEEINPRLGLPAKECEIRLISWRRLK